MKTKHTIWVRRCKISDEKHILNNRQVLSKTLFRENFLHIDENQTHHPGRTLLSHPNNNRACLVATFIEMEENGRKKTKKITQYVTNSLLSGRVSAKDVHGQP